MEVRRIWIIYLLLKIVEICINYFLFRIGLCFYVLIGYINYIFFDGFGAFYYEKFYI